MHVDLTNWKILQLPSEKTYLYEDLETQILPSNIFHCTSFSWNRVKSWLVHLDLSLAGVCGGVTWSHDILFGQLGLLGETVCQNSALVRF